MRAYLVALLIGLSCPAAQAQSSLGITGADFNLGVAQDESGSARSRASATVDVAITGVHGFQGDLSFDDTASGGIGGVAAHLYMAPRDGQKYGVFAALSDVDGRSMMWGSLGAEGMLALSPDTSFEVRAGFGVSDADALDFIFGGVGLAHELTPEITLAGRLDVADFDEAVFRATSWDAGVTATWSPRNGPWGLQAGVTRSGLAGRDGAPGETRVSFGVTLSLGTAGGASPATRLFGRTDPVAPLLRRELW